jgi:hypothetical protein
MHVLIVGLGEKAINAETVRAELLPHLPSRTSPAEICKTLREIRSKAPKQE